MKRTIMYLSGMFCLSLNILYAQENKQLELLGFSNVKVAINASRINILNSISDSIFIGIMPSSIPNTRDNIIAPKGVSNLLQTYVNTQYTSSFTPSGVGLLWNIRSFSVGIDSSDLGNVSYVKIGADISKSIDSNTYQPLGSFDTIIVTKGKDVDLGKDAVTAINALYNYSVTHVKPSKTSNAMKGSSLIKRQSIQSSSALEGFQKDSKNKDWKILSDTIYPKGIYMTFQEFKNDAPSINNFHIDVDRETKKVNLYSFSETDSSEQIINDPWGMSINNELYRYKNGQLYAIEKNGNGYVLSKYVNFMSRKNQATFWREHIGIPQGDDNPFNDDHIYRVPLQQNSETKIEAIKLNNDTGDLDY